MKKVKNCYGECRVSSYYFRLCLLTLIITGLLFIQGSLKVGSRTASMKFVHPEECEKGVQESDHNIPLQNKPQLSRPSEPPEELKTVIKGSKPQEQAPPNPWQRSSDLTPEAWQRQVDQQLQQQEEEQRAEPWTSRNPPYHHSQQSDSVFKDSKTMIIKNVKPTTTVETILKALDPFAYLDERNVRLVKAKTPGGKCFCFVDMDSHEQVKRLVELLTKPRPLYIDGVRVYAEVAKPLKNQVVINRREFDGSPAGNSSILGNPLQPNVTWPQQPQPVMQPPQYMPPMHPPVSAPTEIQGGMVPAAANPPLPLNPTINQGVGFSETPAVNPLFQAAPSHVPSESAGMVVAPEASQPFVFPAETPDISSYLYDATSGFYYDPETTLYYDPNSRYFYNAENQEYLYWDAVSKTYIPVPGGHSVENQPLPMTAEDQAILLNPAADAPLEMKKPPTLSHTPAAPPPPVTGVAPEPVPITAAPQDKKEEEDSAKKDKDEKPKSRAAVKIMKDMERWAKIQNRQKESIRAPSPLLKGDDNRRQSKSADAGFAIFERKISGSDDLFKKPFAPTKKDEKRPMGSLGMLASDYGAGSDDEVEEDKEETKVVKNAHGGQPEDKEDKLTDWKKMACLLCRRQFPNKDALIRHQQLSDLHKQNMEIHLKIKRSKKELEALENQEKELNAKLAPGSPEQKKRKLPPNQDDWAGSSRELNLLSERPGLGLEPPTKKKTKPVVWDHAAYQQAVRKAMFARYKELD